MTTELLKRVLNARVAEVLPGPTPLDRASALSLRLDHDIWFKREDLTPVFSFKVRGAYNRIVQLDAKQRERGVIAASAGNHAQGVAFACRRLGIDCRIVMPRTTPSIKVEAVRRLGAQIDLVGDNYSDAALFADRVTEETGMTRVPPFDDLDVIAGQGTVALELLRQAPSDLGAVFVPVGGGGLASGIATVIKELRPEVQVIGVEPDDSDAMGRAIEAGHPVSLEHVGIFADGVAVRRVGDITFELCRKHLDRCITVTVDEICAAVRDGFGDTRTLLEPAGALAIAGVKAYAASTGLPRGAVVAVTSGANMAFTRLGYVAERAQAGEHREALFAVTIPERKGAFLEFCATLGERGITEFNYRLGGRSSALIFVGIEVSGPAETARIAVDLAAAGYVCVDLTEDDLAKTHVRHMVGGKATGVVDEALYTVEFPERPGALAQFLTSLGGRWNISLFHYRNHGAAFGRVLCGMEVPPAERPDVERAFHEIGFEYEAVSDSPAAAFLLGGG